MYMCKVSFDMVWVLRQQWCSGALLEALRGTRIMYGLRSSSPTSTCISCSKVAK